MDKIEKSAKNAMSARSAGPAAKKETLTLPQAMALALQHQNAGRFPQAERIYKKILQADPKQAVALHLLGVIAHKVGKYDTAVDLITKTLAIKPNYAEARSSLGNAFQELGQLDKAVACFHKALELKPDYVEAQYNLGNAFQKLGQLDKAVEGYHKALAIKPDFAAAHNNLGNALQKIGRLDDAVQSYRKATASKPDYAEAHNNLGLVLIELGQVESAFTHLRRAITLNPENDLFWACLAVSLGSLSFTSVDEDLWQELLLLLDRPTVRPSNVILSVISALRRHSEFSRIITLSSFGKSEDEIAYHDVAEQLSAIPLFLRILELCIIPDLEIERMLTFLRRSMIWETMAGKKDERSLPFSAALALQCFTNEYIYPETDHESVAIEQLQQRIATLVRTKRDVPSFLIVTLGTYRPLYKFPWAQELSERKWTGIVKKVVERQILEPSEEQSLLPTIPCLTAINDLISQSVRQQYEENPYPRWIKTNTIYNSRSIRAVLQGAPLRFDLGDYRSPESPEILIAGCGTGQHSLTTATRFANARVLAVDLSLSSLSYALRKTEEIGVSNIEYAQADIMELGNIGRQFDLIESVGVLHHLGDPLAGWHTLVDLLRPGGVMKVGLYGEAERQDIVSGRSLIAEMGYTASPKDIRQCRQYIISMAKDKNSKMATICSRPDFFCLSNCRDLLFHVQEHRFTLPQIEAALKALNLKFLGFEMRDQSTLRKFRTSFSEKPVLNSLSEWHKFELKNPNIVEYAFWCMKMEVGRP